MRIGIIGLPASGKSTLFALLTHTSALPSGWGGILPASGGESAVALLKIPDPRLDALAPLFHPKKLTAATIEFTDFAALTRGASSGEGWGAQSLAAMREVDALLLVLRAFTDPAVAHPEGSVDPARDAGLLHTELLLTDLAAIEKRLSRIEENLKKGKKEDAPMEQDLLRRCRESLEAERPLRDLEFTEEETRTLRGFQFLSAKPLLLLLNTDPAGAPDLLPLTELTRYRQTALLRIAGKEELEIATLPPEETETFRTELNLSTDPPETVIQAAYRLVGLLTFFTGGEEEVRAWTIPQGTTALRAAGTIHTDMEKGFIRAEVIGWSDLVACGSLAGARKKGLLRLEGKEYIVQDGDVITIRFHI